MSGLEKFGDTKGFVTLTPQGTGRGGAGTRAGIEDLTFLGDVLDVAEQDPCIHTNRRRPGLSNGAFIRRRWPAYGLIVPPPSLPVAGART